MEKESFSSLPLFEGLDLQEVVKMLRIAEDIQTVPGQTVLEQGEPGRGFFLISGGSFDVVHEGESYTVLARLEERSYFGDMSLVTDDPCAASVVCVEEGTLKRIPNEGFQALLDAGDLSAYKVVLNVSRILAKRLTSLEERMGSEAAR